MFELKDFEKMGPRPQDKGIVPRQHHYKWEFEARMNQVVVEFQSGVYPMDIIGFAMHNCGLR